MFWLLVTAAPLTSFAQNWKWAGVEVFGNRKTIKKDVLASIPIEVGDAFEDDPASWQEWCRDLKNQFGFHFTNCSAVRYINFEAYLVVDIVEDGDEYRNVFRSEPTGTVQLATPEILSLHESLYKRLFDLFNQGVGVLESADKGHLDYADKEMHKIAEQLVKLVPKYRDNLLEVLAKDKDINKRATAANLLNWSVSNLSDSVAKSNRLLDDPSDLVRNNISRFTTNFVDRLQSQSARQELIDNLLLQLDRPSHGDRNKAIYNLLSIANTFESDRPYIRVKGHALIDYTAKTSILDNVRGPAADLLNLISEDLK